MYHCFALYLSASRSLCVCVCGCMCFPIFQNGFSILSSFCRFLFPSFAISSGSYVALAFLVTTTQNFPTRYFRMTTPTPSLTISLTFLTLQLCSTWRFLVISTIKFWMEKFPFNSFFVCFTLSQSFAANFSPETRNNFLLLRPFDLILP